jgi:hypothetical protein
LKAFTPPSLQWKSPNSHVTRRSYERHLHGKELWVIDDLLNIMNHTDDSRATLSGAGILTVAVVAAKFFQNHHERTLCMLQQTGYLPKLSLSRFNRRLHALQDVLLLIVSVLGEMMATGQVFVIDTMPVPVCKRVRAERCRKVQGDDFLGYCASKREYYFGWQLHLVR